MSKEQVADADLDALRARAAASDATATEATRRAAAAEEENGKLKARVGDEMANRVAADELAATNALAAAESEASALEAQLKTAGEASDWATFGTVQRKLASAQTRIDSWTQQSQRIKNWKTQQINNANKARTEPRPPSAQTSQPQLSDYTPTTQAWLAKHPEILADPKKVQRAVAYHIEAEADGITADTPEYFNRLEERLGLKAQTQDDNPISEAGQSETDAVVVDTNKEVEVPEKKTSAATAVSPSRRTPSTGPAKNGIDRNGRVALSPGEQEAARFSFPHLKPEEAYREYAVNKVKLSQEGRI